MLSNWILQVEKSAGEDEGCNFDKSSKRDVGPPLLSGRSSKSEGPCGVPRRGSALCSRRSAASRKREPYD